MALPSGTRIGAYEVIGSLGAGGMGEVYLARDTRLDRDVALKLLPASIAADPDSRRRFERAARLAAALQHPHICTIFDVGEADGCVYIAMERVDGTTLRDRIAAAPVSVTEAIEVGLQIAEALEQARRKHVVHRDLKSANVMLTPGGDVKVLDFGLAKQEPGAAVDEKTETGVTAAGQVVGTLAYMSPEQALGQPLDHRSDLFSLGVVLYELLAGRLPFTGETATALLNAVVNRTPPALPRFNDQVPDALVRIVGKLLEKDREQRYQTAREVAIDLRRLKAERASGSAPHGDNVAVPGALRRWPRRRRVVPVAAAVVVAGASWLAWTLIARPARTADKPIVLVLPAEVNGPPAFEKYADSIPGTLSGYLAQIQCLAIKGPPTSGEFARLHGDEAALVRAYRGATYVVKTIVHAETGAMDIAVSLNESDSHALKWREEYGDAERGNYPALMRQAADAVQRALCPAAAQVTVAAGQSANDEAEKAYQEGLFYWNRYNQGLGSVPFHTPDDFTKAKDLFERAVALDPRRADAAARMTILYEFVREAGQATAETPRLMDEWANRATSADPRNGLAWCARATALSSSPTFDFARQGGDLIRMALKAAAYAPDDPLVVYVSAYWVESFVALRAAGLAAEAVDPLYQYAPGSLAFVDVALGKPADALTELDAAVARDPSAARTLLTSRIQALAAASRPDEAQPLLDQLGQLVKAGQWPAEDYRFRDFEVLVARGDPTAAARLREYPRDRAQGLLFPSDDNIGIDDALIALLARRGQRDALLELLKAVDPKSYLTYDAVVLNPDMAFMRSDHRFDPFVETSRRKYAELAQVFEDAARAKELPTFLADPLRQMQTILRR